MNSRTVKYFAVHAVNSITARIGLEVCPSLVGIEAPLPHAIRTSHDYIRYSMWALLSRELRELEITGAIADCGVHQGSSAYVLNNLFPDRNLYLFDTFEGFDKRDLEIETKAGYSDGKQEFTDTCVSRVLELMPHPEKVIVRKGWFPETALGLAGPFALVSIDFDLFKPIYDGLNYFYRRMSIGGHLFVHDYNHRKFRGAREAVRRWSKENAIPYTAIPDAAGSAVFVRH